MSPKSESPDCVFCQIVAGSLPARVIYEDETSLAFLDVAPWHRGHSVVISKKHVSDVVSGKATMTAVAPAVDVVARMLKHRLAADGINVLSSAGETAGQTVFHVHVHVVPRYADEPGLERLINPGKAPKGELKSVFAQIQANA